MSDFLLLFRNGDPTEAGMSPEEMQQHMQSWTAWIGDLGKRGNFKAGDPLEKGGKVIQGKGKTVTDGPYAESKDLIGGYVLITADSLEQAVELSRGCPIFETNGIVEVRAIAKMDSM